MRRAGAGLHARTGQRGRNVANSRLRALTAGIARKRAESCVRLLIVTFKVEVWLIEMPSTRLEITVCKLLPVSCCTICVVSGLPTDALKFEVPRPWTETAGAAATPSSFATSAAVAGSPAPAWLVVGWLAVGVAGGLIVGA